MNGPAEEAVVRVPMTLLLGRAGTGKTETCLLEALASLRVGGPDGPPLLLLVPEQATYQVERAVLDRMGRGAVSRLRVLSFQRLAAAILGEAGGLAAPALTAAGRRMLLGDVARQCACALVAFGGSAAQPGFAAAALRQIDEFEAYALTPNGLRAAAVAVPDECGARLRDLALVWERYQAAVGPRRRDPVQDLAAAAAALPDSSLAHATCWVDGFAGFSPRQERVLEAWLSAGATLHIALCMDPQARLAAEPPDVGPFSPTIRCYRRLTALSQRTGCGAPAIRTMPSDGCGAPPRFAVSGDLAALEAGLWWDGPPGRSDGSVRVLQATGRADEAEACAIEIDRLVREERYRYREVAVVLRDLAGYRDLVAEACARRGIPVFFDARMPARRHPAADVLLAAVQVVASGWSTAAVRRYLQCELCGIRRADADALDLEAVATARAGSAWWSPGPPAHRRAQRHLQRACLQMAQPVRRLEAALGAGAEAEAAASACLRFLEDVGAPGSIADWAAQAEAAGDLAEAQWHRQCWEAVTGLLEQLALALSGLLSPAMVAAALASGLQDLTVGLLPPALDHVLCGAVARSRHPEIRAAFVLGVSEGVFPPPPEDGAILGDADREAMSAAAVDVAPGSAERLLDERYLAYIAVTRASQRLYLSWTAAAGPAPLAERVMEILPDAASFAPTDIPSARAGVLALAASAAPRLRKPGESGLWAHAAAWINADPQRARRARPVLSALQVREPWRIHPDTAAALLPAGATPSRLEAMAACPFKHFAQFGLAVAEREEPGVRPGHFGQLLHDALAHFVRGILADDVDWRCLDGDEGARRAEAALASAGGAMARRLPHSPGRAHFLLRAAGRDLRAAVATMLRHAREGDYLPAQVEWTFAGDVSGRVDRVDRACAGGRTAVRVIDYKTGAAPFRLGDVADGVVLAPALYLAAALEASGPDAEPGGFFFATVRDDVESVAGPSGGRRPDSLAGVAPLPADAMRLHERRLDGAVTGVRWTKAGQPHAGDLERTADAERFGLLFAAVSAITLHLRTEAAAGAVAPRPYRRGGTAACAQCGYLPVCRFDPALGDRYRWAGQGPAWERLRGASHGWGA